MFGSAHGVNYSFEKQENSKIAEKFSHLGLDEMLEFTHLLKDVSHAELEYGKHLTKLLKPYREHLNKMRAHQIRKTYTDLNRSSTTQAYENYLNLIENIAKDRIDYSNRLITIMTMIKTTHDTYKSDIVQVSLY
jgi:hypothetical protein